MKNKYNCLIHLQFVFTLLHFSCKFSIVDFELNKNFFRTKSLKFIQNLGKTILVVINVNK